MAIAPVVFDTPMMGRRFPMKFAARSPSKSPFPRASAGPKNSPPLRSTFSRTGCSTAKSFAWMGRCGWDRNEEVVSIQ